MDSLESIPTTVKLLSTPVRCSYPSGEGDMKEIFMIRSKYLSVIIPVYNEEENVSLLHERVRQVLEKQDFSYEVIYVDDGSKDSTYARLSEIAKSEEHMQVLRFRRN